MQHEKLLSDNSIVEQLLNLYTSEEHPSKLQPIDIALVTYLVLRRTHDHEIFDSQLTIAQRLCSDRRAVAHSFDRLKSIKWISVRKRGRGMTDAIALNVESLPATRKLRQKITPEARELAERYQLALRALGPRRFTKNWLSRQAANAQIILGFCDGNLELARRLVGFAIRKSRHQKKARISLYHARMVWSRIVQEYQEWATQQSEPKQQPNQEMETAA